MANQKSKVLIQFKALSRKALSYQKRQIFSNIFCIVLCPMLLVFISWLIGWIINNGFANTSNNENYVYCSDKNFMDSQYLYRTDTKSSDVPLLDPNIVKGSTSRIIKAVNFFDFIGDDRTLQSLYGLFF